MISDKNIVEIHYMIDWYSYTVQLCKNLLSQWVSTIILSVIFKCNICGLNKTASPFVIKYRLVEIDLLNIYILFTYYILVLKKKS